MHNGLSNNNKFNIVVKKFYKFFLRKNISDPEMSILLLIFKSKFFIPDNRNKGINYIIKNRKKLLKFDNFYSKNRKKIFYNNYKLTIYQKQRFVNDCIKRLRYYPIQYILRFWFFRGRIFHTYFNVLIPRIETEKIIDIAINQIDLYAKKIRKNNLKFLEIGVGSGIISISLIKEINKKLKNKINLEGIGIDINEKCIELTKANCTLMDIDVDNKENKLNFQLKSFADFIKQNKNNLEK